MPAFSDEAKELIMARMRRLMVREPRISGSRLASVLGYDIAFILKLKKKIDRQAIENINRSEIQKDLGDLTRIFDVLVTDMWDIITDKTSSQRDKIAAFKAVFDTRNSLIERKMDAGIFERKLGTLKTEGGESFYDLLKKMPEADARAIVEKISKNPEVGT